MQISKEFLFDFAFMNPLTMKLMNLDVGESVLVTHMDSALSLVVTCWPSTQIFQPHVSLSKNYLAINGMNSPTELLVQKLRKLNTQIAVNMSITFQNGLSSNNPFAVTLNDASAVEDDQKLILAYLKEIYLNKCLRSEQNVFLNYMGQLLVFKVFSIDGQEEKTHAKKSQSKPNSSQIDLLASELDNVSLGGNMKGSHFTDSNMKAVECLDYQTQNSLKLFKVSEKTQITCLTTNLESIAEKKDIIEPILLKDIGGLEKEINLLKEFFINPFKFTELYKKIGKIAGLVLYIGLFKNV